MVKRIFFGAFILILLMQIGYAENTTLIDSYSYDYLANETTVTMIDQIDTDEKTTITFELNTTPGNVEISSVLGIVSVEQTLFTEGSEIISLEFNKVLPGEKELLIMAYNEDTLVAFITNYHMIIENDVELTVMPESLITINDVLYVTFDMQTNMQIINSSAKIISKKGTIYENIDSTTENNKITYAFAPKESSDYNLYEVNVNGYVKELNNSLGSFDFSPIKNFKESKTDEGLILSFDSDCSNCEKEITLFSEEDEYVYTVKINSDSVIIPSDVLYAMEINGPYKVNINYNSVDYDYLTQAYDYGVFEPVTEEVIEEVTEETQDTTSDSGSSSTPAEETIVNETTEETVEEEVISEEVTEETPANETETTEETVEETTVEETDTVEEATSEEQKSNLLTGFSVSNIKQFANEQKTMVWGGLALIIVLGVLAFMYVRQRKDAYLYEM